MTRDTFKAKGTPPCELCESLASANAGSENRGEVEPVAWRYLRHLSGAAYAWTRWLGMDELHHYGPNGDLVKGPAADWKVEYAYSHPPQAQAVNDELGRRPIAWAVQSKAYGLCYSFSNEFIEAFPNAPVNYVVAQAGAGDYLPHLEAIRALVSPLQWETICEVFREQEKIIDQQRAALEASHEPE